MGQILVRQLNDTTIEAVKKRAAANKRSMEAEVRAIIEAAISPTPASGASVTPQVASSNWHRQCAERPHRRGNALHEMSRIARRMERLSLSPERYYLDANTVDSHS